MSTTTTEKDARVNVRIPGPLAIRLKAIADAESNHLGPVIRRLLTRALALEAQSAE